MLGLFQLYSSRLYYEPYITSEYLWKNDMNIHLLVQVCSRVHGVCHHNIHLPSTCLKHLGCNSDSDMKNVILIAQALQ